MPLNQTSGNVTTDAYGGGVVAKVKYIEDFFQTWLRTGTGSSATVTTGLDASTNKALVWTKSRSAATDHKLTDTVRGATKALISDTTGAQTTDTNGLTAFSSTGYTIGTDTNYNNSDATYVDWEFVATPKFFDVVTWTGTGATGAISHSHALGSTPGFIVIKAVSTNEGAWYTYHTSLGTGQVMALNSTAASSNASSPDAWTVSSTQFSVNTSQLGANTNGTTYVAYLFAHDAGGFGLTGTDNVISCGSFTCPSSGGVDVNLGYEPQYILMKKTNASQNWVIYDTMRGWAQLQQAQLYPNITQAEDMFTGVNYFYPTATGFRLNSIFGLIGDYIYIAIRRGPMKVPTDATKVFTPVTYSGSSGNQSITGVGFPPDLFMANWRANTKGNFEDRLRGTAPYLQSTETAAEASNAPNIVSYDMSGITLGVNNLNNKDGASFVGYFYQRAPSFFDEVCFTQASGTQNHNLGVAPELVILKSRSTVDSWYAFVAQNGFGVLNDTGAWVGLGNGSGLGVNLANVTATTLSKFGAFGTGNTAVAYLFATCAGVSKVGSYTGTGATQTIACGFTGGARFVLVKRTDSTGDWYVWDTARGMVSGTDPSLLLNSTAAEVNANSIYTATTGFQIVSTAAGINASGGTYIFLAIA
jgi:hypothetical protein